MSSDKVLLNLLKEPFGPYLEETVLSDKCKFVPSKRLLLENFQMAYNNEPTGLDYTEFAGDSTPSNVAHLPPVPSGSRVYFRGVLSVHAPSHLSQKGLYYLDHDFKERVTRSALNGVQYVRKYTSLNLETVFAWKAKQKDVPEAERYNIRVLIQGYMHTTASFMRSDLAPDGLLIHTANAAKSKFRIYQVVSMDIETYKLSRTFLFRYHTLRTIRDILKSAGGDVPQKCTPQWFLENYFLHYAYPSGNKWKRTNYLEDVESSDEGTAKALELASVQQPPDAQTHGPRHLRTVHRNEVWSIFASHSRWILSLVEKHKDLKGKVNTSSWRIFLVQIPQLRQRAMSDENTAGNWGLLDEQGSNKLTKIPISDIPPPSPSVPHITMPQSSAPKDQKQKVKNTTTKAPSAPPSGIRTPPTTTSTTSKADEQLDNIYDSDFSQGSLSPTSCYAGSWLSYSAIQSPPSPPDPSLYALIPHEMSVPPALPANMIWHCPIGRGTCQYVIDLCTPSDENLQLIRTVVLKDESDFLLRKEWKSDDEQVYMIFYDMVNAHWEDHLKELDIKHVKQGNGSTFEWIHPQRHESWPPRQWNQMRARRETLQSK